MTCRSTVAVVLLLTLAVAWCSSTGVHVVTAKRFGRLSAARKRVTPPEAVADTAGQAATGATNDSDPFAWLLRIGDDGSTAGSNTAVAVASDGSVAATGTAAHVEVAPALDDPESMRKLSKSFISTDDFAGVAYDDRLPRAPRDLSGTLHRFFRDSNISVADFVKSYYEVKPLFIERRDVEFFADLMSVDDVPFLASGRSGRAVRILKASDTHDVPIDSALAAQDVYTAFADKRSVVLHAIERTRTPIRELMHGLERALVLRSTTNAYFSPPYARGLETHWDLTDVFVLQVAGTKLWHVCQIPGVIIPIGSASEAELELPNQRCMNVTMYPGSVLYMPRGTAHTPVTGASESLHLTLAMDIKSNWADYLRVLMDASLSETIDEPIKELTDLLHPDNWFSAGRKPPTVSRKALLQETISDATKQLWQLRMAFPLWLLDGSLYPLADIRLLNLNYFMEEADSRLGLVFAGRAGHSANDPASAIDEAACVRLAHAAAGVARVPAPSLLDVRGATWQKACLVAFGAMNEELDLLTESPVSAKLAVMEVLYPGRSNMGGDSQSRLPSIAARRAAKGRLTDDTWLRVVPAGLIGTMYGVPTEDELTVIYRPTDFNVSREMNSYGPQASNEEEVAVEQAAPKAIGGGGGPVLPAGGDAGAFLSALAGTEEASPPPESADPLNELALRMSDLPLLQFLFKQSRRRQYRSNQPPPQTVWEQPRPRPFQVKDVPGDSRAAKVWALKKLEEVEVVARLSPREVASIQAQQGRRKRS